MDRRKRAIYAAANIPVYWIVDLTNRVVEVYSQPSTVAGKYGREEKFIEGDVVPVVVAGKVVCEVCVDDILPAKVSD